MLSYIELRKKAKEINDSYDNHKVAIVGDCSTQQIAVAIKGYGNTCGLSLDVFDADYNQLNAQIIDKCSDLYSFNPESIIIFMCTEKLYENYCSCPLENREQFAERILKKIEFYWQKINEYGQFNIFQCTFYEKDDRVFGSNGVKNKSSFIFQLRKLNYLLYERANSHKNVFLIDMNYILQSLGRKCFCEDKLYHFAKMSISEEAVVIVAKTIVDLIMVLKGRVIKCVVLDLDNTLWGGVIGDDGINKIQIGELGNGQAFTEFQLWLKELKNRGIILAVCSKNDEKKAREPFINHPDMILKLEDISLFVANWENKVDNILRISNKLNIGLDSMVYIDDSEFERNHVKSVIGNILVPDMPEDPSEYVSYLKSQNYFEVATFSELDKERTKQYRDELNRASTERNFTTYDEYLKSLDMIGTWEKFKVFNYARIAQLTQRSNQFNLRTIRYTEAEIDKIANDDQYITMSFNLKDKYGGYGLISVVILKKQEDEILFIDTWLMSCRVLKRGMEEYVVNKIVNESKKHGYKKIVGEYIRTTKNSMVENIYKKYGFNSITKGKFVLDIQSFSDYQTNVHDEN